MILDCVLTGSTVFSVVMLFVTLSVFMVFTVCNIIMSRGTGKKLFLSEHMYSENVHENDNDAFLTEYGQYMENILAQKTRGSIRMGIGKCYTPAEYEVYRKNVLLKELP
ncbi:MAG: hypothetical protein J1F01_00775 [Oscillospiraceae bacterium]|nr:hypothetical protein [Oscillospiraceae bacterium]